MKPRIRTIKPEALLDEVLWDLEESSGLPIFRGFVGLWTVADREGRFEWRPRALKSLILPYWTGDFADVLNALEERGFIVRYEVEAREYGCVRTFKKHQVINKRESESTLPAPPGATEAEGSPPGSEPDDARTCMHVQSTEAHVRAGASTSADAEDTQESGTRARTEAHVHARASTWGREGKGRELEGNGTDLAREGARMRVRETPESAIDRARSAFTVAYQVRYEREAKDAWMGAGSNGQAIATIAAWCAAVPDAAEARAAAVVEGIFADPWLGGIDERTRKHRRWPLGPVAKDPAKYASLTAPAAVAPPKSELEQVEAQFAALEKKRDRAYGTGNYDELRKLERELDALRPQLRALRKAREAA